MSKLAQEQQWAEHIRAWKTSGLTQKQYAQEHGLKPHQLSYWNSKLVRSESNKDLGAQGRRPNTAGRFVPVRLSSATEGAPAGLVLTLPSGHRLSGITPGNASLAAQLSRALT